MFSGVKRLWNSLVFDDTSRFYAYVLGKAMFVVIVLLLLWALKDKDVVVVYMKF